MTDCLNESTTDDDEAFNTSYVESSFASAANFSKSLNDIHVNDNIIDISMRPNSLAIRIDDNLTYSCNNINDNVSTSLPRE